MEKKNYSSMYKNKTLKEINEEVATAPVEEPAVTEAPIEEIEDIKIEEPKVEVEEVKEKKVAVSEPVVNKAYAGVVTGGLNLNVRKSPNGEVIRVLHDGERVEIKDDTYHDWYEIYSPVKGFVMKKFIKLI